jgi:hypothetical protein
VVPISEHDLVIAIANSIQSYRCEPHTNSAFLSAELLSLGFIQHPIRGDGHCQLHALTHQLSRHFHIPCISAWRRIISRCMIDNIDGLYLILGGSSRSDVLLHFNNFGNMANSDGTVEWGSEYSLYQISLMYRLHITVYSPFESNGNVILYPHIIAPYTDSDCIPIVLVMPTVNHYESVVSSSNDVIVPNITLPVILPMISSEALISSGLNRKVDFCQIYFFMLFVNVI